MAWIYIHISVIYVLCSGLSLGLEIYFSDPNDGYFLKPIYHKKQSWDPLTRKEGFVVTRPSEGYVLGVRSGPYEKEQVIPQDISSIYPNLDHVDKPIHHGTVFGMDVSAKVVTNSLSPKYPRLQVLIHASPHINSRKWDRPAKETDPSKLAVDGLCGHVFVQHDKEELSSICVLGTGDSACVNGIMFPTSWWHENSTVQVYYAFSQKGENQECASASNSIVPGRLFEKPVISSRRFLADIVLSKDVKGFYREREEDILIDVPTNAFDPGTVFEVPVKFDAGSDMRNLVMSARVRQGLMIIGAEADQNSPWQVHVDVDENEKAATVTAYLKDPLNYRVSNVVQDVFAWRLQVEPSVRNIEAGRVVWSIKYEKDSRGERYLPSESQVISKINLRDKENARLVTVLKVDEILNFAVLTGKTQSYPLHVYLVRDSDSLFNAVGHAACHSKQTDVLKVAPDCSYIYVNGSESRGSHNVTIITKSGQHTAFTNVKVWIPMNPLDIQVSDSKLSRIRSWKVGSVRSKRRSRQKRVVDLGMLTHPSVILSKKYKQYGKSCQLRLQQALVDVYAKFYIATPAGYDYFVNRQAALKITDLMENQLRVADPRIVSLENKVLQGQSPGLTEIQVTSANGRVLAARVVRVGNDKVEIERLIVNLVTGITLDVYPSKEISGAWSARGHIYSKFQTQWQSGILDIHIEFSDGTRFPLDRVSDTDYYLEVVNRNHILIKVIGNFVSNLSKIKVYAVSDGRAESIKVSLKQGESCPKKKMPTLSSGYVITEADFSEANQVQSDRLISDGHFGDNRASDRYDNFYAPRKPKDLDKLVKHQGSHKDHDEKSKKVSNANPNSQTVVVLNELEKDLAKSNPQIQDLSNMNSPTRKEPLQSPDKSKLSPLEIGMYVLIAVFCVGISVFLINCIVFMVRHKKKRKIHKRNHKEPVYQAKDWVWIGRATLERSSVKTECSQSLMPAEDFNGNHTNHLRSTSSQSRSSSSRGNSANSSNRNSFVSTIKGSECSIRITANPLSEDANSNGHRNSDTASQSSNSVPDSKWDYEAMGLTFDQLADYFDNLKESSA